MTARADEGVGGGGAASVAQAPAYRTDLDGLRAFAIGLVVVYHVWIGRVSGGVDVFLLLSAFFLTGSLVRRGERGRLKLGTYYAHRFWRLVPPAVVTIGATAVVAYFVFPSSMWQTVWDQSIASALYYENWELALTSTDYYARDAASLTPFLHFWSLSIQGQVFVLWPLLLGFCWVFAKVARLRLRSVALVLFTLVFGASLAYSIVTTHDNQTFAYFDTAARLWEFAIGSLLALVPAVRAPRAVADVVSWLAVAALVSCGMVLEVQGGFPGYLALWPTLAAGALIMFGANAPSARWFLSSAPLRWLAKIAYALYLVHWPVLITWMVLTQRERPDFASGALIVGISLVLAVVLHLVVERPLQRWRWVERRPYRTYVALAACVAMLVGPIVAWHEDVSRKDAEAAAQAEAELETVSRNLDAETDPNAPILPLGTMLDDEWVVLGPDCTDRALRVPDVDGAICQQTEGSGDGPTVAFVGDSHAEQFAGTMLDELKRKDATVYGMLLGGCTFRPDGWDSDGEPGTCERWNREVDERVMDLRPDVVVMMGTKAAVDSPDEAPVENIAETASRYVDNGSRVILLRDNPRFSENMFVCIEQNRQDLDACSRPASELLAPENPIAEYESLEGVYVVDLAPYICPDGTCRATVGNIAVYLDDNHLTWTFARVLGPVTTAELASSGFRWIP